MQPQGTGLINTAFYDNMISELNKIENCAGLQVYIDEAMATVQAEINAIEAQIASLSIVLTIPTDLGSVITWITNYIHQLTGPYSTYLAQLTATLAAIARLTAAVEAAAARLTNCHITMPVISLTSPSVTIKS